MKDIFIRRVPSITYFNARNAGDHLEVVLRPISCGSSNSNNSYSLLEMHSAFQPDSNVITCFIDGRIMLLVVSVLHDMNNVLSMPWAEGYRTRVGLRLTFRVQERKRGGQRMIVKHNSNRNGVGNDRSCIILIRASV